MATHWFIPPTSAGMEMISPTPIAVDASRNAYITGQTDSPNFPTKNAAYSGNARIQ